MPFYRIIQTLETAKSVSDNKIIGRKRQDWSDGLILYLDSEIFDYYDPLFDADAGDMVAAILKYFPGQVINITTRGWYLGDRIGLRAAEKLVKLITDKSNYYRIYIRFSIDLFDTKKNALKYTRRMVEVLKVFSAQGISNSQMSIGVLFDGRNQEETRTITDLILYLSPLAGRIIDTNFDIISRSNRADKLGVFSTRTYSIESDCLLGYHLTPSGQIIWNTNDSKSYLNIPLWHQGEKTDITHLLPRRNANIFRGNNLEYEDISSLSILQIYNDNGKKEDFTVLAASSEHMIKETVRKLIIRNEDEFYSEPDNFSEKDLPGLAIGLKDEKLCSGAAAVLRRLAERGVSGVPAITEVLIDA